jgi:hypothetical protein
MEHSEAQFTRERSQVRNPPRPCCHLQVFPVFRRSPHALESAQEQAGNKQMGSRTDRFLEGALADALGYNADDEDLPSWLSAFADEVRTSCK